MVPVQAALFWAFATGATFALSAARQLQYWRGYTSDARASGRLHRRAGSAAASPYLLHTVLFAAVLLAPTGLFLLWYNPSWGTMQVADDHDGVWAGFALLYAGGVTIGAALGFLVAQLLILYGAAYWAFLVSVSAHFLFFGTLLHGWDGSGYRRLLTTNQRDLAAWSRDPVADNVVDFVTSGTFLALLVFAAGVMGTLLLAEVGWLMEGWDAPGADADRKVPRLVAVAIAAAGTQGLPLLGALTASGLVRLTSWPVGLVVFAVIAYLVLIPRRTPVRWLYGLVGLPAGSWEVTVERTEELEAAA
ncbi:hypothetical protein G5C51_26520 [Streptomyces sp. A7024]|uniref:Uncharacterized protein n=1 Tax=Streptomyces coryli TaxID=1128680 RepID=A0A6G4U818_9ACTN|nr:hypothetical protein [Streptomyces coryli]NGN67447.1 hypothetical protein [Streptomyces coryli]